MERKILVIGATGLLGSIIYQKFQISHEVYGTYFNAREDIDKDLIFLDATEFTQLSNLIMEISPDVIINCMGLTSVELCEKRPEACWKLNTEIPMRLAQISNSMKLRLIHISSDHFASAKKMPRKESDIVFPINQYGYSKFQAEKFVNKYDPNALILRTNFFARARHGGKSLLDFAISSLNSCRVVTGFEDVLFSPVGAREIANFLLDYRSSSISGILNLASKEVISKFEFLTLVSKILGREGTRVVPGSITSSNLSVIRPNYLALDSCYLIDQLGYELPSLEQMLRAEMSSSYLG